MEYFACSSMHDCLIAVQRLQDAGYFAQWCKFSAGNWQIQYSK